MKIIFWLVISLYFFHSCSTSSLTDEEYLGGDYYFVESGYHSTIIRSINKPYDGTGIEVIPAYVEKYKFNKEYIIALSINLKKGNRDFYLIDKATAANINDYKDLDAENYQRTIKRNVIGPLDSIGFTNLIKVKNIALQFNN